MPMHRNATVYVPLPEHLVNGRYKEAKATISLNFVVPPNMEKESNKYIKKCLKDFEKGFVKFVQHQ